MPCMHEGSLALYIRHPLIPLPSVAGFQASKPSPIYISSSLLSPPSGNSQSQTQRERERDRDRERQRQRDFSSKNQAMAHPPIAFIVGIFGNIVSFMCFLAPLPTFYRVCKKKSTEGFQSIPYVAALFSAMLWIFYAYIKTGEFLIITINAVGCVIEIIYLAIYITYCPKKARVFTLRLILLLNIGGICIIVLLTHLLSKERAARIKLLGWICVVFSTSVFVAPLSIIRVVIRTKSVEFMPFTLSLLLTVSAVMWLTYGVLLRDIYISLPNFVGLAFGTIQMVLYCVYRNHKPAQDQKLPEHKGDIENGVVITTVTTLDEKQLVSISQPAGDIQVTEKKEKDNIQDQTEQNNNNKTEGEREISSKV